MRKARGLGLAATLLLPLLAMAPLAAAGYGGLRDSGSPAFSQIEDLYRQLLIVSLIIFFLVEGLLLWALVRFRERRTEA